jgi:hypothetical protein
MDDGSSWPVRPAVVATFFLLLGLGVVWFARKVAGVQDGAVLASFVIVPAFLFVVLRGDLKELRGPGGWAASFVRVARTRVRPGRDILDVDAVQIIEKESTSGLTDRVSTISSDDPVVMTITIGTIEQPYTRSDVQSYLKTLRQFPRFHLVAFLDSSRAFVGCMSPARLDGLMRSEVLGNNFLEAVGRGDRGALLRFPGMGVHKVSPSATNADALQRMTDDELIAIPVVDEDRRLQGTVGREQLISRLVLSLAQATNLPET